MARCCATERRWSMRRSDSKNWEELSVSHFEHAYQNRNYCLDESGVLHATTTNADGHFEMIATVRKIPAVTATLAAYHWCNVPRNVSVGLFVTTGSMRNHGRSRPPGHLDPQTRVRFRSIIPALTSRTDRKTRVI